MQLKEYGDLTKPILVFLHGGGLSSWEWRAHCELLGKDYRILTPDIDGHGDDFSETFLSVEDSAEKLLALIDTHCGGKVHALCGFCLGGQIAVEALSRRPELATYAVLESVNISASEKRAQRGVRMLKALYPFLRQRWFARIQSSQYQVQKEQAGDFYSDVNRMSEESLAGVYRSSFSYVLPEDYKKCKAKTLVLCGDRERADVVESARLLASCRAGSVLRLLEKEKHGYNMKSPDAYVEIITRFFRQADKIL